MVCILREVSDRMTLGGGGVVFTTDPSVGLFRLEIFLDALLTLYFKQSIVTQLIPTAFKLIIVSLYALAGNFLIY